MVFVWVRVNGQLFPQLWHDDRRIVAPLSVLVAEHRLARADAGLDLDTLAAMFPPPEPAKE